MDGNHVVPVMNYSNSMDGMNSWFWIIILLFFRGGAFGGYGESPLISEEFIKRDIFNTNQNVSTTSCQTQRDVLENRYNSQLCCCETQKEILENRYATSLGLANVQKDILLGNQNLQSQMAQCCCDLRSAIHAEGEATRDLITQNTINDLRERLSLANNTIANQTLANDIVNQVKPCPIPAYLTCSPYQTYGYYGCGNTTIA